MNTISRHTVGLLAVAALVFLAGRAHAQTTSAGPYYATPSWDQTLACTALLNCPRFIVLSNFNSEAVLDRETGLVWERSPATTLHPWSDARFQCTARTTGGPTGGRKGWRLPSVHELASLVDPNNVDPTFVKPALPPGHPFLTVQSSRYWSASTNADNPADAWGVSFVDGNVGTVDKSDTLNFLRAWCVRGGMNADAY